jgi:hypothetical protein
VIKEGHDKLIEYKGLDFVYGGDVTEDNLLAVCGTDGYKSNLRIITTQDKYLTNCNMEEGKFT